jgi:hypothetical protein
MGHPAPGRNWWAMTRVMAVVLHSSKALKFECDTWPRSPRSSLVALSLPVDHDGVFGGARGCGVSTVSANAFALLPATRKQYKRILSSLP